MKRKVVLHTVRPAMLSTPVYCSPSTVDPSAKDSDNISERSCAVELASGSYCLCHALSCSIYIFGEGKKRSPLPVSTSTVPCQGSVTGFEPSCRKVIPVKFTGAVPTGHCCDCRRPTGRCHWHVRKVGYSQKGDVVRQYSSRMWWEIYFEFSCQ